MFATACACGDIARVRELLALTGNSRIDVHAVGESAFRLACVEGHVAVVRELLALSGDRRIDVHAHGEYAFQDACVNGHVAVVRELLALTGNRHIDVHADDEYAFREACDEGKLAVVRELLALDSRAVSYTAQKQALAVCSRATVPWTETSAAWAACPARSHMHTLCPSLRSEIQDRAKALQWGVRRSVILARRRARVAMGFG